MIKNDSLFCAACAAVLLVSGFFAQSTPAADEAVAARIAAKMAETDRGPYDAFKDGGRKPVEMMSL